MSEYLDSNQGLSRSQSGRATGLRYIPNFVRPTGLEPMTFSPSVKRSELLSYSHYLVHTCKVGETLQLINTKV